MAILYVRDTYTYTHTHTSTYMYAHTRQGRGGAHTMHSLEFSPMKESLKTYWIGRKGEKKR